MELQTEIILDFIIVHITFTRDLYFLLQVFFTFKCSFILIRRTPFSISCRRGLVVMNSLSFVLFFLTWKCVNFSLTFEEEFCLIEDSWLIVFFLSFSTLNISVG